MELERFAEMLVADLRPVRRVAPPWKRLLWWLAISIPAAIAVALVFGLRPGLIRQFSEPKFAIYEAAAVITGIISGYVALCAGLPDQPSWKLWLPLAPLVVWLATLGQQCTEVLVRFGPGGIRLTSDAMCLPAIAIGGLVPAVAMVVLLRRSRNFRVTQACLCGALAAAALGAAALRLYHAQDAAFMVLVWQLGSVVIFTVFAAVLGRLTLAHRQRRHV